MVNFVFKLCLVTYTVSVKGSSLKLVKLLGLYGNFKN